MSQHPLLPETLRIATGEDMLLADENKHWSV